MLDPLDPNIPDIGTVIQIDYRNSRTRARVRTVTQYNVEGDTFYSIELDAGEEIPKCLQSLMFRDDRWKYYDYDEQRCKEVDLKF